MPQGVIQIVVLFLLPTWLAGMFVMWRLKRIRQTMAAKVYLAFFTVGLWITLFVLTLQLILTLYPPPF